MQYGVDVHGADTIVLRMRAIDKFRDEVINALRLAAFSAGAYMKVHVPFYSGAVYRAIFITEPQYRPGGAGGGGTWTAMAGVDASLAPHVEPLIEGSGLYNRDEPKNGIFPANGNVMVFKGSGSKGVFGEKVFTRYVAGQKPQRAWFEDAMELANQIIERELHGIELDF